MEGTYYRLNKGSSAAHSYLILNNIIKCQLILDWTYDAIYYKYYNDEWIILSIGPKTPYNQSDFDKINTDNKVQVFKNLADNCLTELPNYSIISDQSLITLRQIKNLL